MTNKVAEDLVSVQPMTDFGHIFVRNTGPGLEIKYSEVYKDILDETRIVFCPHHHTTQMVIGQAMSPWGAELIRVWKCPICGHSHDGEDNAGRSW